MRTMGVTRVDIPRESRVPEICYAVGRLERAINAAIVKQVAPHGLTTLQYTILSVLQRHGEPLSNAQLARRSNMRPQSMAEVLDALEAKGLIRREAHPSHGRLLPARVTPRGRRVLAACDKAVIEIEDRMFEAYSPARRKAFVAMARVAWGSIRSTFLSGGQTVVLGDEWTDEPGSKRTSKAALSL
jgi:DNA-binding MarR family transcriptional regulator